MDREKKNGAQNKEQANVENIITTWKYKGDSGMAKAGNE